MEKSEFANLADLVTQKGVSYSTIVSEIHDKVLSEYHKLYPAETKTVDVVVDAKSGEIRLMRDKNEVTPDTFSPIAEKIAREVLIEKLKDSSDRKPEIDNKKSPKIDYELLDYLDKRDKKKPKYSVKEDELKLPSEAGKFIVNLVFWGYNAIFLLIIFSFITNINFSAVTDGNIIETVKNIGLARLAFLLIAGFTPFVTSFIVIKYKEKITPEKLAKLFLLFEVPLVFISIVCANVFSTPSPFVWFLLLMFIFAIPVFLINLMKITFKSEKYNYIVLFLRESLFLTSFYITLLFTYFTPLVLGTLSKIVYEYISYDIVEATVSSYRRFNPFGILIAITFGGMGIALALALTSAPYLLTYSLAKIFKRSAKEVSEKIGAVNVKKYLYIFAFVWFALVFGVSYQPSADRYINLLEDLHEAETFEEKEEIAMGLLDKEDQIKRAFDNLTNVRRRYLMAKDDDFIKDAYEEVFGIEGLGAEIIHDSFTTLAYPFVYQGSLDRNYEARNAYNYLFGETYKTARNVSSAKNVELFSRDINVETSNEGLIVKVSIDEVYTNSAFSDQEVIYEFSLPEDAVVTELLLGPNLEFTGVIAPKGAAQETYERQIVRRRDPALLEQTGPTQYRLRVYPVPSKNNRTILNGRNQRIKFTYITPVEPDGYPLPVYTKEENIKTKEVLEEVRVDGKVALVEDNYIQDNNYEELGKKLCSLQNDIQLQNNFASYSAYLVPNTKIASSGKNVECDNKNELSLTDIASGLKIAIAADVSYANKENKQIEKAVDMLHNSQLIEDNDVYLVKFNDLISEPKKLEKDNLDKDLSINYFGIGNWINSYNKLEKSDYDFVILITDSQQPASNNTTRLNKDVSLYVVHGETIPPYTTNITTDILQSGGSSFDNFTAALNSAIIDAEKVEVDGKKLVASGEYFSYYTDSGSPNMYNLAGWNEIKTTSTGDLVSYLFASKFLKGLYSTTKANLNTQVAFLDNFNDFSKNNSIVGPHSSLIALVNEFQLNTLESLSENLDRYRDETTPRAETRGQGQTINLTPEGIMSNPLSGGGIQMFGSLGIAEKSAPVSDFDSAGTFNLSPSGSLGTTSTPTFSGLALFVIANVVLLGGGVLVFILIHFKNKRRKK
ncbi:hypothetical protein JXA63_00975 [Candidatus Woesebacteria bacterium]|nr:hypothetical protein [Candidatus Woesebacteria bacterium]